MQILQADLHTFPYRICWANLFKDQSIFLYVIILLIPLTFSLDDILTLFRRKLMLVTLGFNWLKYFLNLPVLFHMCPWPVPSLPSHIFLQNAFDCVVPPVAVRRVSKQILSYSQTSTNGQLSTTANFFWRTVHTLTLVSTSLQWPLASNPKVAVVEKFNGH